MGEFLALERLKGVTDKLVGRSYGRSAFIKVGLISFLAGVGSATFLSWEWILVLSGLLGVAVVVAWFRRPVVFIVLVILACFTFGLLRFFFNLPHFGVHDVGFYRELNQELPFIGVISSEPDLRSDAQYLVIQTQKLEYQGRAVEIRGKVLIKTLRYPEFSYGDQLRVGCKLQAPVSFEKFSYASYLAKDDIFVVCYKPRITVLGHNFGSGFWAAVFALKHWSVERINRLFTEPEASLMAGLLLGLRRTIPQQILDDFNAAGLTHVLAISGYNVSLMITVFGGIFKRASRRMRFIAMVSGIFLLVLFTGFSASVIRAAIMGGLVVIASLVGRKSSGLLILLWSGGLMVFANPRMLMTDLSFQLSFLSTLGLILFMPSLEKLKLPLPDWAREGFLVTLAAQVFTTPLLLFQFGRFSLIAPFANIVVLPFVPFIMFFGFFAVIVSAVFVPVAQLLGFFAWVLLKIILFVVSFFAHLPMASIQI